MPETRRLSATVDWATSPVPTWRRAVRWLPTVVGGLVAVALSAEGPLNGPARVDPPHDGGEVLLGVVAVRGQAPQLPARYPSWQPVHVYVDRATVTPGATELTLPLPDWRLVSSRRRRLGWARRKAVDARWELRLNGPCADVTVRGSWLLLAHLGTFAGWPEPH